MLLLQLVKQTVHMNQYTMFGESEFDVEKHQHYIRIF